MKNTPRPQSTTSLPRAPHDAANARSSRYLVMMGIRVVCFILMVVITPYGWYTWVLGAAAVFLPYIAVVIANVGEDGRSTTAENPERALPAAPAAPAATADPAHTVIRIEETPVVEATPAAPPDDDA